MAIWRMILCAVGGAVLLFAGRTGFHAIAESWNTDDFPEALAVKVELLPVIFPIHMVTGGLALLLVPAVLLVRQTRWHKPLGRIAAIDILTAGFTAIPVALEAPVTRASAFGFSAQAVVCMALLVSGIRFIRMGRRPAHEACMLLMAAVTSGAMFFRIYLALWAIYGSSRFFSTFYACDAWVAWSLPLAITAGGLWLKRQSALKPIATPA